MMPHVIEDIGVLIQQPGRDYGHQFNQIILQCTLHLLTLYSTIQEMDISCAAPSRGPALHYHPLPVEF